MRRRAFASSVRLFAVSGFMVLGSSLIVTPLSAQDRGARSNTIHGKPVVVRTAYQSELGPEDVPVEIIQPGIPRMADPTTLQPAPSSVDAHALEAIPEQHHFYAAPQVGLWAGYQSTKKCGCVSATCTKCNRHRSKSTVRKALGKLTAGIDILLFGKADSCGCDTCDSGCDVQPTFDGECDSIGTHIPASTVHAKEAKKTGSGTASQADPNIVVPADRPMDRLQQVPQPPAEGNRPGTNQTNPFLDDPITGSVRRGTKPAGFRR